MKAVILAAGEGVRMRPLTLHKPKPMLELLGKPLLHHLFDVLPNAIDEVIVVVGYLEDHIRTYFTDRFGRFSIRYVHQEKKLGTGHGLYLCRELLGAERFLMLYADDLQSKEDLERLLMYPLALLTQEVEDPRKFGVVVIDDNHDIIDIVEKPDVPPSHLVSTGAGILDAHIFHYPLIQHKNGEYYLTDCIAGLIKDRPVKAVAAKFWFPIGYAEDIARAEEELKKRPRGPLG